MAYQNKIIYNKLTGQDIKFLKTGKDTDGQLLEMESVYNSYSKEPTPHFHPHQDEDFKVLEGSLNVRINGKIRVLQAGDILHIAKNTVHSMWNGTDNRTVVNWKVRPALNTENLLETATGLVCDGKTNEKGMPNILQLSLMGIKFSHVTRFTNPPYLVQKIIFNIVAPFALLAGYRPVYKKYID